MDLFCFNFACGYLFSNLIFFFKWWLLKGILFWHGFAKKKRKEASKVKSGRTTLSEVEWLDMSKQQRKSVMEDISRLIGCWCCRSWNLQRIQQHGITM